MTITKSFSEQSEQMEEQLEPRPEYQGCALSGHDNDCQCLRGCITPLIPWDHSDRHEQIHEQTQD